MLDQHVNALQSIGTVRMVKPVGPPHQLGRQLSADKAVEPRGLAGRERNQAEAGYEGSLRQLDLPPEGLDVRGMELQPLQCRTRLIRCRGRCKSYRHQPFAPGEKGVETLNEVTGSDDAEQLDVVGR